MRQIMSDAGARLLDGDFFEEQTFRGGDLGEADLGSKELVRCAFKNVKMMQSRWKGARLEDCTFDSCDLTRIAPDGLMARGVQFIGCKMIGIDWSGLGDYPEIGFDGCDLRYASFVSLRLRKTRFERCDFRDAQLVEVDLGEASFRDCQLGGARFERCDLRKTSFAGASDLILPPQGNRLAGTRVPLETALQMARALGVEIVGD
jgi:fluoroquinolone resistance protein